MKFKKIYTRARIIDKDVNNASFTAVASSATLDRHGEVVSPEGWDLENYKKDPVLLWSHDHTIPAIGKATKVWVEGFGAQAKLMFSGMWQTITEEGRAAAALVESGILNSFSVGFLPYDMVGNTYTSQELLEISLVNVPANPDAIMLAYKSLKDKGFDEKIAKRVTQQFAGVGAIRKDLFSTDRGALQDELDIDQMYEMKDENMEDLWEIFWAFCDVYYDEATPVDDFSALINEMIDILQQVADGTYSDPDDVTTGDNSEQNGNTGKVIDNHNQITKTGDNKVKVIKPTAPMEHSQTLRTRQSVTKAIVKAADQLLAGEKRGNTKDERAQLAKIIKRGAEILSKSNKGEIRDGKVSRTL